MTECGFTYDHYIDSCNKLINTGTKIFMRHDVDFDLETAMNFAILEYEGKVNGNYYIRMDSDYYNPWSEKNGYFINMIAEHQDIGLHYSAKNADLEFSCKDILSQIHSLETIADVKINTISQHRPATFGRDEELVKYLNQHRIFDINQNNNTKYLSDSGMNWREGCLCKHIGKYDVVHINTHPIWWGKYQRSREDILQTWAHRKILENEKTYKDRIREFKVYDEILKKEKDRK